MSLKSIRESYQKLLDAFESAGVKLNESQKKDADGFVSAVESAMSRQRETAIRQTKRLVEARMEREYGKVFESIMENMRKNSELASAIQEKAARLDEQRKVSEKVDGYLDLYVESVLPKKAIVDYDRMQRLEKAHNQLREALQVSEDDIVETKNRLEESYRVKNGKCETEIALLRAKLNESEKTVRRQKFEIARTEAKQLLESKVKNLPEFEADCMRKILAESSKADIEKNFDKTLDEVKKDIEATAEKIEEKTDNKAEEKPVEKIEEKSDNLENDDLISEVEKIITDDDILKDRPHNAHVSVKENEEEKPVETDEAEEDFETLEEFKITAEGDIELDDNEIINESIMRNYCRLAEERT